jgi:predicted ATPase
MRRQAHDFFAMLGQTLELLEVAAYFGARFDVRDIAEFRAMTVEDVESLLWKTLHQGTGLVGSSYEMTGVLMEEKMPGEY